MTLRSKLGSAPMSLRLAQVFRRSSCPVIPEPDGAFLSTPRSRQQSVAQLQAAPARQYR